MAKLTNAQFIEAIKEMSMLELNELVKAIEEEFGVTAAAPVAVAAGPAEEAPTEVTIKLAETGANKVAVIKLVREITGLGLMEAKQVAETVGSVIKEDVKVEEANELKKKFEEIGAKVTLA
ncbi:MULTISPECIES: 50S ribosomal protein L7/L12 [Ureaplasma]|uniref:Large ribosomal subunit protein bL12 n=2 Tax=Ureaplasma TaxID=2129 RepID=A0ABT3BPV0_9BACT|nr:MULTISPECIES: 50S ribosomal protein L7/L12 [Ureaplasma]MCV3728699.1 50S ribosomal protein L7/L12 [Ureaplasma miroungigenitalium]MCV3734463.1 50S ribosomal protein L7/L12 [Ureaplasma miroungigenitalium]MCV3754292.1 50S ribosomal protein L7/L12 [Ureaplasma zalophigenitalium]